MTKTEWESIDDSQYMEAGEKKIVQVTRDGEYIEDMEAQNKRVIEYLREKNPKTVYRLKWNNHEFGMYQEVEELKEYEDDYSEDDEELE